MARAHVSIFAAGIAVLLVAGAPGCASRGGAVPPPAPAASAAVPAMAPRSAGATSHASALAPAAAPSQASATSQAASTVDQPKRAAVAATGTFGSIHAGLEEASSEDCLGCHADTQPRISIHDSHKIGLDVGAASAKSPDRYRPLADVRSAGVWLEGGKIGCLTCHDLASEWQSRIALPQGAVARRAVLLGDSSTYGEDGSEPPEAKPGDAISAKPLCVSCHAF
jgi:hypothetical protein